MKKFWGIACFLAFCSNIYCQQINYVTAFSGLNVRDEPSLSGEKIGKLEYASQVIVLKFLGEEFTIRDQGKNIWGQWAKIQYLNINNILVDGYLFSGFLTSIKFPPYINIKFESFELDIQGFEVWKETGFLNKIHKDTAIIEVGLGGTPENKYIRIKQSKFREG